MDITTGRNLRLREANGFCHGPYTIKEVRHIILAHEGMIGFNGMFYDDDRKKWKMFYGETLRNTPYAWVLEDITGAPVARERIIPPIYPRRRSRYFRKRSHWPGYRCPHTIRVIRESVFRDPDGAPSLRGRQRHLPTAWDDIKCRRYRSWKAYRKTQYKCDQGNQSHTHKISRSGA